MQCPSFVICQNFVVINHKNAILSTMLHELPNKSLNKMIYYFVHTSRYIIINTRSNGQQPLKLDMRLTPIIQIDKQYDANITILLVIQIDENCSGNIISNKYIQKSQNLFMISQFKARARHALGDNEMELMIKHAP